MILARDNSEFTQMDQKLKNADVAAMRDESFPEAVVDGVFRQLYLKVIMYYEQLIDKKFYKDLSIPRERTKTFKV